jgi:hypothetical protein
LPGYVKNIHLAPLRVFHGFFFEKPRYH